MKSGYEVAWTEHALAELNEIFLYLESNFSDKEIGRLSKQLESTLRNISKFPALPGISSEEQYTQSGGLKV